jgi:SAM-dependent methyltransferase
MSNGSTPHPLIFDRTLLRARRARAAKLGPETFLIDRVAEDMVGRLSAVLRNFDVAADIGTPTDAVRRALTGRVATIVTTSVRSRESGNPVLPKGSNSDWAELGPPFSGDERGESLDSNKSTRALVIAADEEALPFRDGSLDLVVSALALQFVNDLPGTLIQFRRALKPDGLFVAALIGGDSLSELRQAFAQAESEVEGGVSPRVAPFADLRDLGALLQRAGFALPVTDIDRVTVRYSSPLALMHDLRRMGATNVLTERRRRPLRRATLQRLFEIYAERFADPDGRIRSTFEIVWLSGWAPHESQQQPLKPGSAKTRLADALHTAEIPAGEKAGS